MQLPSYFLKEPTANWDDSTVESFEHLYREIIEQDAGNEVVYTLSAPKWQFLSYLCQHKNVVLHGSAKADITEFEPRKANDISEFGDRCAVYAASDGIWPMYFAIVNRELVTSLMNSCCRILEPTGKSEPYYFFSINEDAMPHYPWQNGTIYLLPGDTFEPQPRLMYQGLEIEVAQWASPVAVKPLARLAVSPVDFPFLEQVVPHDPAVIRERARVNPDGFPWVGD